MRVAVVHGFYRSDVPSGENLAVTAQVDALRDAGHEVELVAQRSDERMRRRTWPIEGALTTVTGLGPDPTRELQAFGPDVVHVHNLFPHFSTRWLAAWRGPVVATLHNFRPLCAVGTMVRDGRRCTRCVDESPAEAVRHACFKGSRLATAPLAIAQVGGPARHPVIARADRLVVISQRAADEYERAGIPGRRFDVVPNFVPPAPPTIPSPRAGAGERWLYAGRLSREKGLPELLDAWPGDRALDVIGDGEDAAVLRGFERPAVHFLGRRDNAEIRAALPSYTGLVVPSQWPEAGPPLTYLEALAAGTPVVAFAGNGAADDVARRGTGVVVPTRPGTEDLTAALDRVVRERASLAATCRTVADEVFAPSSWTVAITRVYRAAVSQPAGVAS
ncbi:glycosyltransferase family 4 protein [Actinomycetospora sp. OC33-EN08]|uniref:Glycosyltransferase family 4 protein n=1 Tax=Actinomycetospora aurantiaca TaxID=3129233 RepID=A0ABU8MGP6_9PSEU